jgi:hypothetical protein
VCSDSNKQRVHFDMLAALNECASMYINATYSYLYL